MYKKVYVFIFWGCLTNYHRSDGLQPQAFIVSQCWRPEVLNHDVGMLTPPHVALGENSSHAFLPASGGSRCYFLVYGHITPISASIFTLLPTPLVVCLLCVSYKTLVNGFGGHPDNPEWSLLLKIFNLMTTTKTLFPNKWTFTGSRVWCR